MIRHKFYIESSNTRIEALDRHAGYELIIPQLPHPLRKDDIIFFSASLVENGEFVTWERDIPTDLFKNIYGVVRLTVLKTDNEGFYVYALVDLIEHIHEIKLT